LVLAKNRSRRKVFRDSSLWRSILQASPFPEDGGEWGEAMNAQVTKLEGAENDLKQLMADVTRAMEKAQEAVARIAPKAATPITEAESMSSSRQNSSS
jgi:hypothetical protein